MQVLAKITLFVLTTIDRIATCLGLSKPDKNSKEKEE